MDKTDMRYGKNTIVKEAVFELKDELSGKTQKVIVVQDSNGLKIKPVGYGESTFPITLDFFDATNTKNNPLHLVVRNNNNEEDFTHKIDLSPVRNS